MRGNWIYKVKPVGAPIWLLGSHMLIPTPAPEKSGLGMRLAEKCIWTAYLYLLKQKYRLGERVFKRLVELYMEG